MASASKNEHIVKRITSIGSRHFIPRQKHRRLYIWAAICIGAIVVSIQLAYPYDKGVPFASVGGVSMRLASHSDMAKTITEQFDASKVKVTVGKDASVEFPLKVSGAELNTETMIESISTYPLWQRFIPGSILWQAPHLSEADVFFSSKVFHALTDEKSKQLTFEPKNAHLAIKNGVLLATEAVAGSRVKSDALLQTMAHASYTLGGTTVIEAPAQREPAARSSNDLAAVREQAQQALGHTVTITVDGKTFSPNKNELASWIILTDDPAGNVTLSVDKGKMATYLEEVNRQVETPAGQTDITIVDGREVSRTTGATGQAIDAVPIVTHLATALLVPPSTITIPAAFVPVQPSVIFNSRYTTTQAGLQAYVDDVARTKNMHIMIQQLDGDRWSAQARAAESIPSASTYKLFVALVLFDKIDKGEIHWDDSMLDTTVAGCFERMTVASTNPCAEKWIAEFGRQYINDFIYARGFSTGTTFIANDATHTTAADLSKFMTGLNDGTLVSGANRDRLLDSLGRHPYRYGIPTGSAGAVHDKVGFLWDYIHDTAIVQHPRGTYIMTIMTKGQSYAAIAAVTRQVERIMYP